MLFYNTSADETYYGGSGRDTVVFSGAGGDYDITVRSTNELYVSDFGSGANDGDDTLFSIERLEFTNGTLAFDLDGTAGQAYRIYQAAFDRTPDVGGLSYWIETLDTGVSLTSVAADFLGSAEFQQVYGRNLSDSDFISELYFNVLGRSGETSGVDYWLDELDDGVSRASVLANFSESVENVAGVAPSIAGGIWYL